MFGPTCTKTLCVLSLGLLVDRAGFTFLWRPGNFPELVLGKNRIACQPSFNAPWIYSSRYLEQRRRRRLQGGDPAACPGKTKKDGKLVKDLENDPSFEQLVEEEMKGAEDLIPQLEEGSSDEAKGASDKGATQSPPVPVVSEKRSRP